MGTDASKYHGGREKIPQASFLKKTIKEVVQDNIRVIFAYLYGSVVDSENFKDIDVALYTTQGGADSLLLEADIQTKLSERSGLAPDFFDVRVINNAPVDFAITILTKGKLLFSCDEDVRSDYIERIASTYRKDFRIFEAI